MKLRKELLVVAVLLLVATSSAQATPWTPFYDNALYSNGPDGYGLAIGIGSGNDSLANAFTLSADATLTGVKFSNWLAAGTTASSIHWAITTTPLGGVTRQLHQA